MERFGLNKKEVAESSTQHAATKSFQLVSKNLENIGNKIQQLFAKTQVDKACNTKLHNVEDNIGYVKAQKKYTEESYLEIEEHCKDT